MKTNASLLLKASDSAYSIEERREFLLLHFIGETYENGKGPFFTNAIAELPEEKRPGYPETIKRITDYADIYFQEYTPEWMKELGDEFITELECYTTLVQMNVSDGAMSEHLKFIRYTFMGKSKRPERERRNTKWPKFQLRNDYDTINYVVTFLMLSAIGVGVGLLISHFFLK